MLRRSIRLLLAGYYQRDGITPTICYKETPVRIFKRRRSVRRIGSHGQLFDDDFDYSDISLADSSSVWTMFRPALKKTAGCLLMFLIFTFGLWNMIPGPTGTMFTSINRSNDSETTVSSPTLTTHARKLNLSSSRPVADGMPDFALESLGASVMQKLSSETYQTKQPIVTFFGIPLWWPAENHRTVIQGHSVLLPGRCWAFAGRRGHMVIFLSHPVTISHVTLDHIPKRISPTGRIDSAPKNFAVFGMSSVDAEGTWLGSFMYNQEGRPTQTFKLHESATGVFQFVKLVVETNWGHQNYTCLYRFRVHGKFVK